MSKRAGAVVFLNMLLADNIISISKQFQEMKKLIYESEWLYGGQCAVPYFFAVNFASQYLMGGVGKKFNVACYVTYGRMACSILYKKNVDIIYGDIMRNVR